MRLWHKDLIEVLPRQQLLGQWRECCCIAANLDKCGTPNHILVNKILDYPIDHFYEFTSSIIQEMKRRGYKVDSSKFWKHFPLLDTFEIFGDELYANWHNTRYFKQCFHNLEEKFDCGGITAEEFSKIKQVFEKVI